MSYRQDQDDSKIEETIELLFINVLTSYQNNNNNNDIQSTTWILIKAYKSLWKIILKNICNCHPLFYQLPSILKIDFSSIFSFFFLKIVAYYELKCIIAIRINSDEIVAHCWMILAIWHEHNTCKSTCEWWWYIFENKGYKYVE